MLCSAFLKTRHHAALPGTIRKYYVRGIVSLSIVVLKSRDWYKIVRLHKFSLLKKQPYNKTSNKPPELQQ